MHLRLMNVAQVLMTHAYVQTDLRPHCVEISERDGLWLVVMFSMYRGRAALPPPEEDPVIVGRLVLPGTGVLRDPLDPASMLALDPALLAPPDDLADALGVVPAPQVCRRTSDMVSWTLTMPGDPSLLVRIRPHDGESIWVDESFGKDLPVDVQKMHESKRAHMASLIAHQRFLTRNDVKDALRAAHENCIAGINGAITKINRRLEHMEY